MAVTLEIRDGDPWWSSPDIWVVPGIDPNGRPGQPTAGEPAFLWAQVRNIGDQATEGARVNFYWSNPAAGVLRSSSTLVGSAFVDLNAGEEKQVLCVIPWIPVIVNCGHECLVVEVMHADDPLPSPLPDNFDPPTYHQVAQKNLSVLAMKTNMMAIPIQIPAPLRMDQMISVGLMIGENLDRQNLELLGLDGYQPANGDLITVGLSEEPGYAPEWREDKKRPPKVPFKVLLKGGIGKVVYLNVRRNELKPRTYVPVHVIARDKKNRVVGGITYILIKAEEG